MTIRFILRHTRTLFLWLLSLFFISTLNGQNQDSTWVINLKGYTVTAFKEEPILKTSLNVKPLLIDSLTRFGNYNLTSLMAQCPGVSMLSTGVAIAKPVIRGLYGNRVLVLLSGLKFDNQQWQEEHGLGLPDLGLSKVELVKGPMSVLYGTEAIGGIINLIEEEKPEPGKKVYDLGFKFNTNTLGGMLQAGYKINYGKKWFRLRIGIENNADYSDGNNQRVLNSRFDAYYLKSTFGFRKQNWSSVNNFMSSFNRFGFIFNDVYNFVFPDDRWSRKLDVNPAHLVLLNILSSENKFELKNGSVLKLNVGFQSNERMENEGGGAISLNMHLMTFQYLLKWEKKISKINRIIISNLSSYEDNKNYGARKIIPNARMQESNVAIYLESDFREKLVLENGIGFGEKWLKTYFTPTVNSPEKDIHPFTKFSPYYNFFSGLSYLPSKHFNCKLNVATGVRVPNLAELSSNGLHEGIFTYEIGDPGMKNEQNLTFNLSGNIVFDQMEIWFSPFYNHFNNYVYLASTNEKWFGYDVFRYKQQDANQFGAEAGIEFKLFKAMTAGIVYSGMRSKTADGNFTAYVPAQKVTPSLTYYFISKRTGRINLYTNADYCFRQDDLAENEKGTPSYWLWNMGINTAVITHGKIIDLSIAGTNLLNKAYYDHLSRFKNYDLLNIGRNIVFKVLYHFPGNVVAR